MKASSTSKVPSSTVALSRANREEILRVLGERGALSKPQISDLTGMAPATVNRLVSSLMVQGLVVAAGKREGTGGRPSILVALNGSAAVVATMSVESGLVRTALYDLGGALLDREDVPIPAGLSVEDQIEKVLSLAHALVASTNASGPKCVALGISIPGVVEDGGLVTWAPALGWRAIPIGALLEQRVRVPVVVENDANALVLAEYHRGASQGVDGMVAIAIAGGIGAGIVLEGRLFRGARWAAGEIGYMLLGADSLKRYFPDFGDLEQQVGTEGITRRARLKGVEGADLTVAAVFERADAGSAPAQDLIESVLDDLALALANICVVIAPNVVVLGGAIGAHAEQMIPGLRQRLMGRIPHVPEFVGPSFGSESFLIGVGQLAFSRAGSPLDLVP